MEFKPYTNLGNATELEYIDFYNSLTTAEEIWENLGLHQNRTENTKDIASEAEALGMFYVIEAASLGGNVIKKQLQKNPDFFNVEFNYFGMYGEQIGAFWKNFTSTINTYFSEKQNNEVLKGAERAYAELISY